MPINKKNGSRYVSIKQLVDIFYTSRFNRDQYHGLAEGEDIDNSRLYRLYNKSDLLELMELLAQFFEWAIIEKNIGKIYITKDLCLIRESSKPRLKKANFIDVQRLGDKVEDGKYYITSGKYKYSLFFTDEAFERLKKLQENDIEFIQTIEELKPLLEEKNADANSKCTNESKD